MLSGLLIEKRADDLLIFMYIDIWKKNIVCHFYVRQLLLGDSFPRRNILNTAFSRHKVIKPLVFGFGKLFRYLSTRLSCHPFITTA